MRWNGSTIGKRDEPENLAGASGVWSLRDQDTYQRSNQWTSVVPTAIPNLSLWLDASDSSTLFDATTGGSAVAADGAVARWEDKSGYARHAIQATANNRPLRRTAQYNGRDVLDFDGSNDRLTAFGNDSTNNIGLTHLYTTDSSYSFFAIAIADTVSTNSNNTYENRAMWGDAAGYTGFYFRSNNTAGVYNYVTAYQTATVSYTAGSLALFGAEHSGGSLRVRLNAGSETSTSAGAMNILARVQNFQFGRQWNADSYCLDGKIGEIIFYNRAVSSVQRQAIEGYLAHKWGLSSSLPATHPYKNVVP